MNGKRLRRQRESKGYTQEYMAQQTGVAPSAYAMWEANQRDPGTETLKKLADILDCPSDYLLDRISKTEYEVFDDLPEELRKEGIKMLLLTKEAARDGLTAEDYADILDYVRSKKRKK